MGDARLESSLPGAESNLEMNIIQTLENDKPLSTCHLTNITMNDYGYVNSVLSTARCRVLC